MVTKLGKYANVNHRPTSFLSTNGGFTIIEVMIVLAIAALILLVVFYAVPSLQRGQRNNARKTDAARLAASVVEYASTSNNSLPGGCTNWNKIYNSSANLSQFSGMSCSAYAVGALPASDAAITDKNIYGTTAGVATYTAPVDSTKAFKSVILVGEQMVCQPNTNDTIGTANGATVKSLAILYTLETGSTYGWGCVTPTK